MGFVFNHKHHIRWNVGGRLVSLPGEGDLRPLLPATLDVHRQDLVLAAHRAAVRIQTLAGNLHLLGAAREDLLQAHLQLVHHGRVLLLLTAPVGTSGMGFERPLEPPHAAHPSHAERREGVVDVHVVVPVSRKELIERAASAEELCEHCVRVSVEGVVVARTVMASASTSSAASWTL